MIFTKQGIIWQVRFLSIVVLYVTVEILTYFAAPPSSPRIFWLSGGLAVGMLSRWSLSLLPAVLVGALVTNYYFGLQSEINLILSLADCCGIAALFGIQWIQKIKPALIGDRKNTSSFFFSTLVSMLIPALCYALIWSEPNFLASDRYHLFFVMWISSTAGILLGAKLTLEARLHNIVSSTSEILGVRFLIFAAIFACTGIASLFQHTMYAFDFLCFLLLAYASLKFGSLVNRLIAIAIILVAALKCKLDAGIYSNLDSFDGNLYLLSFIGCAAILGFFISTAREDSLQIELETEQLRKDKELQMLYLKAVVHSIPDLLLEVDKNNKCIAANGTSPTDAFSADTLIGVDLKNILTGDSYKQWCKAIEDATNWSSSQGRVIQITENEKSYWFELSITKKQTDQSQNFSFICIARDITKRLENHQADLANEKRFRNIFDTVENISVQGYNRTHEVIYWNKASEKLYGYTEEEALGKKLEDLIVPHHMRHAVHTDIEGWHMDGIKMPAGELTLRDKKNNTVFVYSNHIMIETHKEKEMFCLDIDVGQQRRALARAEEELSHRKFTETSLRESERRFRRAQVMGNIALWNWTPETNTYSINDIALQFLNLPVHDLNGDLQQFITSYVVSKDRDRFLQALEQCKSMKTTLEIEVEVKIDRQLYKFLIKGQNLEKAGVQTIEGIIQAKIC